jgi:metal-responsive CopG/Arc/MetJ family transcriptional regulator
MELDIELPDYLYNRPDDYYAKDVIQNRDETIEELKKDSVNFKDRLHLLSTFRHIKFIPKKFSVINSMGKIYKSLSCDIVLKNVILGDTDINTLVVDSKLRDLFDFFKKQFKSSSYNWDSQFGRLARLIGMEDYELKINDIIFEDNE